MKHVRGVAGFAGQVVSWLVILGVAGALAAGVVVPRLAGATPYTVLTGSMSPGMPPGTLVVVRPVAFEDLRAGDVITYQRTSGEADFVTHRVVSVATRLDGERVLITQGDANPVADEQAVRSFQVRGQAWYAVPHLGRVGTLLTGDQRAVATTVLAAGLLGYAAVMFASSLRDRRRRARPGGSSEVREDVATAENVLTVDVG